MEIITNYKDIEAICGLVLLLKEMPHTHQGSSVYWDGIEINTDTKIIFTILEDNFSSEFTIAQSWAITGLAKQCGYTEQEITLGDE